MNCYGNYHAFEWLGASTAGIEPQPGALCSCGKVAWKNYKNNPEALVADIIAWREDLVAKNSRRMRIFMDTEFTGLHQGTTLISLALVADDGNMLYCEFNDYDRNQVDDWIAANVIPYLWKETGHVQNTDVTYVTGSKEEVVDVLRWWLTQWASIEIWGDCLAYDWMLFCELFGSALQIPDNVFYIPFDLATALNEAGIDPDIDRRAFSGLDTSSSHPHNALDDALVIQMCWRKLNTPLPEFSNALRWSA